MEFRVNGLGFEFQSVGLRVQGSGFRVQGSGRPCTALGETRGLRHVIALPIKGRVGGRVDATSLPVIRDTDGGCRPKPYTLHSTPYTLHPTPCTLHPTPYTLHPTPYTLHPTPYTLHPTPCTPHPTPYLKPSFLNTAHKTRNPNRNPKGERDNRSRALT